MSKDEFVDLHGEELWNLLVVPLQKYGEWHSKSNANIIVHNDILMPLIERMSVKVNGMKDLF